MSVFDWRGKPSETAPKKTGRKPRPKPNQNITISSKQREISILRQRHVGVFLMAHPSPPKESVNANDD